MKKSSLALASVLALTLTGAAHAQSSQNSPPANGQSTVTFYGIIDVGVQQNNPKTGDTTTLLSSGTRNGSRFGFRGAEDLGDGTRMVFALEGGINVDTGSSAQSGRLFGRQAYGGLANDLWGEVRLGRQQAASYEYFGQIDPFLVSYNDAGAQTVFSGADGLRFDNTIEYRSPLVAGLQGLIGYSTAVGTGTAPNIQGEVPGLNNNLTGVTAGLQYQNGPLSTAASYERYNCAGNTTAPATGSCSAIQKADQQEWQLGAVYDFKIAKLHAMYGHEKGVFSVFSTVSGTEVVDGQSRNFATPDSTDWLVGTTIPLAGGRVIGSYMHRDDTTGGRAKAAENNLVAYAVGYEYDLSKRTILWVYGVDVNGRDNLNQSAAYDRYQYGLGVRHAF